MPYEFGYLSVQLCYVSVECVVVVSTEFWINMHHSILMVLSNLSPWIEFDRTEATNRVVINYLVQPALPTLNDLIEFIAILQERAIVIRELFMERQHCSH